MQETGSPVRLIAEYFEAHWEIGEIMMLQTFGRIILHLEKQSTVIYKTFHKIRAAFFPQWTRRKKNNPRFLFNTFTKLTQSWFCEIIHYPGDNVTPLRSHIFIGFFKQDEFN